MKRVILSATLMLAVCVQGVRAQIKVDVEAFKKQVAKSDEDIANPKKNTKAIVWADRGKLFLDIANAPTQGIYSGLDDKAALLTLGKPIEEPTTEKIGDNTYRVSRYGTMVAYSKEDAGVWKFQFWVPTLKIVDNPLKTSFEAYMKAYELDQKTTNADKVKLGQQSLANAYKQEANNYFSLQKYAEAGDAFSAAYDAQIAKPYAYGDTLCAFNAGFLYTVSKNYEKGIVRLNQALSYNYENDGDTYYYLYHCYYGLKNNEKAKEVLLKGLDHFPTNTRIVEGLLSIYTAGEGDPKDIVPYVLKAIESDPKNANLYAGLGLIYDKLGESDKAIDAFKKALTLSPNDFSMNFNYGLLFVKKGDAANTKLNEKADLTENEHKLARKEIQDIYRQAFAPLENALAIQPGNASAIELLRNLSFRLRDEPGMADAYSKYDKLFKALPAKK